MPRKPPPKHGQFKPGQSGNPGGKPIIPPEVKEAYKLTQHRFTLLVNKYLSMNREQLRAAAQDPAATTLDLIVLKVIQQAIEKGDQVRLSFILDRLIGKVVDKIESTTVIDISITEEKRRTIAALMSDPDSRAIVESLERKIIAIKPE